MIAPTLSNPFLNSHFNQLDGTQNVCNNTFDRDLSYSSTFGTRVLFFDFFRDSYLDLNFGWYLDLNFGKSSSTLMAAVVMGVGVVKKLKPSIFFLN